MFEQELTAKIIYHPDTHIFKRGAEFGISDVSHRPISHEKGWLIAEWVCLSESGEFHNPILHVEGKGFYMGIPYCPVTPRRMIVVSRPMTRLVCALSGNEQVVAWPLKIEPKDEWLCLVESVQI